MIDTKPLDNALSNLKQQFSKEVPIMSYKYIESKVGLKHIAKKYKASSLRPPASKSHNFMTPETVAYIEVSHWVVELSFGKGIGDHALYGITVMDRYKAFVNTLSCSFTDLPTVSKYIEWLDSHKEFNVP